MVEGTAYPLPDPGRSGLLATLMARPRRILSVQELASAGLDVQGDEKVVRSALTHHIHRLHSKLEADLNKPRIQTIRGGGYQFEPSGR